MGWEGDGGVDGVSPEVSPSGADGDGAVGGGGVDEDAAVGVVALVDAATGFEVFAGGVPDVEVPPGMAGGGGVLVVEEREVGVTGGSEEERGEGVLVPGVALSNGGVDPQFGGDEDRLPAVGGVDEHVDVLFPHRLVAVGADVVFR